MLNEILEDMNIGLKDKEDIFGLIRPMLNHVVILKF
jgi:hypothetical protein